MYYNETMLSPKGITRLLPAMVLTCSFLSPGCDNGEQIDPDSGVAVDPAALELRRELTSYCESVSPAVCAVAFSCCDSGERGYFDEVGSERECPGFIEESCLREVDEVVPDGAGNVILDEDLAEETLERLDDADGDCDIDNQELLRLISPRRVLAGVAPNGAECRLNSELPICREVCTGDEENGFQCGQGADVGGDCLYGPGGVRYGCAQGLVCLRPPHSSGWICGEQLEEGEACSWESSCQSRRCYRGVCEAADVCREPTE